jgi:hypothetical protein
VATNDFTCYKPKENGYFFYEGSQCNEGKGVCYYSDGLAVNVTNCNDMYWRYKFLSTHPSCLGNQCETMKNSPSTIVPQNNNFECINWNILPKPKGYYFQIGDECNKNNGICYYSDGVSLQTKDCDKSDWRYKFSSTHPSCLGDRCVQMQNSPIVPKNNNFDCINIGEGFTGNKKIMDQGFYFLINDNCNGGKGFCYYSDGINGDINGCDGLSRFKFISGDSSCNLSSCNNNNNNVPDNNEFICGQQPIVSFDSFQKKCYFYGVPSNNGNGYNFVSSHESCMGLENCRKVLKIIPNEDQFHCNIPNLIAPQFSTYWNGNYCFFSNGDPQSKVFSLKKKGFSNGFFYGKKGEILPFEYKIDGDSSYLYTFVSGNCNQNSCNNQLQDKAINGDNFICPGQAIKIAPNNQALFKNGYCFFQTPTKTNQCYYASSQAIVMTIPNSNVIDNTHPFCYSHYSGFPYCTPEDCTSTNLKNLKINDNNFLCSTEWFPLKQPSQLAPVGDVFWNGNICFYSNGFNGDWFSIKKKGSSNFFFFNNKNQILSNDYFIDLNGKYLYTYYSRFCNQKTCNKLNLLNMPIDKNEFVCPGANGLKLVQDDNNVLYKNGICFVKPLDFDGNNCVYPSMANDKNFINGYNIGTLGSKVNDNIEDQGCYGYGSSFPYCTPQSCQKSQLDPLAIKSNNFECYQKASLIIVGLFYVFIQLSIQLI